MKATLHIGKGSAKHNDRNFAVENAKHINAELLQNNRYIFLQNGYDSNSSFDEMEQDYYQKNYGEALKQQNEKFLERRQKERIKKMKYWLKEDKKKMPDEMILQCGNKNNYIDCELLYDCIYEFCKEFNDRYKDHIHMLNLAFHNDEATPHIHLRMVYDYIDDDGIRKISLDKALEALGIEPPKPTEKVGRYNNRKQTFTEQVRFIWHTILKRHNIEIDEEVVNSSQKHLDILNYKSKKLDEEINNKNQQLENKEKEIYKKERLANQLDNEIYEKEIELRKIKEDLYKSKSGEDFSRMRPVFEEER